MLTWSARPLSTYKDYSYLDPSGSSPCTRVLTMAQMEELSQTAPPREVVSAAVVLVGIAIVSAVHPAALHQVSALQVAVGA